MGDELQCECSRYPPPLRYDTEFVLSMTEAVVLLLNIVFLFENSKIASVEHDTGNSKLNLEPWRVRAGRTSPSPISREHAHAPTFPVNDEHSEFRFKISA